MKRKEIQYLMGGIVIGAIIGMLLILLLEETNNQGTVADPNTNETSNIEFVPQAFYLVEYEQAQAWLTSILADDPATLEANWELIAGLIDAEDISSYWPDANESIELILATIRKQLIAGQNVSAQQNAALSTCIGIDQSPYNITGPGVYVYIEVPTDLVETIPEDWEALDTPKENNLLWTTQCYTSEEE